MGIVTIKLPDVGEGIAEAELVEWNVAIGELVREDQILTAVMTYKATVEIPPSVEGKVVARLEMKGEQSASTLPPLKDVRVTSVAPVCDTAPARFQR